MGTILFFSFWTFYFVNLCKPFVEKNKQTNKTNAVRKNVISFSVTCSPDLPNIREIISKHQHILISIRHSEIYVRTPVVRTPVVAFCKNALLRQRFGTNTKTLHYTTLHYQKRLNDKQNSTKGECISCKTSINDLHFTKWCQVIMQNRL